MKININSVAVFTIILPPICQSQSQFSVKSFGAKISIEIKRDIDSIIGKGTIVCRNREKDHAAKQ